MLSGFVAVTFGCGGGAGLSKRGDRLVDVDSGGFSSSLRDCCLGALCFLGEAGLACFSSGVINSDPSADCDKCFFLAGEREGVLIAGISDRRESASTAGLAGGSLG